MREVTAKTTEEQVKAWIEEGGDILFDGPAASHFLMLINESKGTGDESKERKGCYLFHFPCKNGSGYFFPWFTGKVKSLLKSAAKGLQQHNILLTGPAGTGKTQFVYSIFSDCGFDKVYQINGSEEITEDHFYGAVQVRSKDGTSVTEFVPGVLYKAMTHGTKVDEDGHQVMDENGDPIVVGKPALFFIDEFAALLPSVFLGVCNRALDRTRKNRQIEVPKDGGRIVKAHPGFAVVLAGNTVGAGNMDTALCNYTAQSARMDESTRDRITGSFEFDYSADAERSYLSVLGPASSKMENAIKELRTLYRDGKIEMNVTTRHVVTLADIYKTYKEDGVDNALKEAIRDGIYTLLPSREDKNAYNEVFRHHFGADYDFPK